MSELINVYCDESCHLEHDRLGVMLLGAVWAPQGKVREISNRIREIKIKHRLSPAFEVKWTKVSHSKVEFYLDLLDYFFDNNDLHFRVLVIPDKTQLRHEDFGQTHDSWYYKMYFELLKVVVDPRNAYEIYLDVKDTKSRTKEEKLHEVLCNAKYDFRRECIQKIQTVRSHEVELLQLTDLLIGAVSYVNRGLLTNAGKVALVERLRQRSGYSLIRSTALLESKVNIFRWQAQS